jgi:hypothetical protein
MRDKMTKKIYKAYCTELPFIDVPPITKEYSRAPTTSDTEFSIGYPWIYKPTADTAQLYHFGGIDSSSNAIWLLSSPGSSDVDQLKGDSGTATPASGIINILGGTNVTTVGGSPTGDDLTINLDAAITLATSVTSPLYTAGAGADVDITAPAGQNVVIKLGDAAGANKLSVTDNADVEQFAVDSNGGLTFSALTVAGNFAQTGGTFNVGQDNAAHAINIGGGTTARAIGIANSAAAHTLTIGNAACGAFAIDTGAGISIDGATASNFTVTGASEDLTLASSGGSVGISASEAAADAIVIEASDGAGGVQIKAGTGGILVGNEADTSTIDVGDIAPTASRTITVGGGTVVTASVTDTIDIGPDGATTNADSVKTVNVNTGGVTTGQVLTNIASGAITSGTHTVSIQSGNAAAGTVATNLSTGTGTKTVNVGNADANTTINLDGALAVNTDVNGAVLINTGTSTGAVTIGNVANSGNMALETSGTMDLDSAGQIQINSSGSTIDIGNDAVAQNMNIGTGAAARTITVGNITGATAVNVNSGSGACAWTTTDGAFSLITGTGTVSLAGDAAAKDVTLGNTTGASSLTLQAGTGEITMTGTVKQIDAELMGQSGIYVPTFTQDTVAASGANTGGVPTGNTGDVNVYSMQGGSVMQGFVVGAGQTILQPIMGANGLIINADKTNTEGMEYNFPYLQYTIGTSAAFAFELDLYINDMDGAAPYVFGFRKTEANNADWTAYNTLASMGMIAASSITNIVLATELNAGGQTITDTTDAWGGDGTTNTLRVLVDASGNVTYTINGAAPSATAAFQFDNADVVIPFIRIGHNASATDVAITGMRIGFQA